VKNVGSSGNQDGIKLSGVIGFHLNRVQVLGWGETGTAVDLVGCHNGLIENSFFKNNSIVDGHGVRPKGGTKGLVIRANRFETAGERPIQFGGSTERVYFRPQPAGVYEAQDIVAEGNVIIGSPSATAYANNIDNSVFHHNFIYRPTKWVRRILHDDSGDKNKIQKGAFTDNVVVWQQGDVSVFENLSVNAKIDQFVSARNTWFNETNPAHSRPETSVKELEPILGQDPGLDVDKPVVWPFDWGIWVVNATAFKKNIDFVEGKSYRIAVPTNKSAVFDPRLAYPLIGDWELKPIAELILVMADYSQIILIADNADSG